MADSFQLGRPDFGPEAGEGPRGRMGVLIAAFLALAASGGLAWWMLSPERPEVAPSPAASLPATAPTPPAAPQPLRFAPDEPDPAQVKTAHADVQATFVAGGPQALQRASAGCAKAVPGAPQRLDYCLAYDTYAREIVSAGEDQGAADWFADQGRDLALARTALPAGADAANRMAQVQALAQAVLPKPKPPHAKAKAKPKPKPKPHAKVKARHAARRPHPAAPASRGAWPYSAPAARSPAAPPEYPDAPGEPFEEPPH